MLAIRLGGILELGSLRAGLVPVKTGLDKQPGFFQVVLFYCSNNQA